MIDALLRSGDLKTLFIERLGWDYAHGTETIEVEGLTVDVQRIAHKRGFQVFEHRADRCLVQTQRYLRSLQVKVSALAHEHVLIVSDHQSSVQVWAWSYRDRRTGRWQHRMHPCFTGHVPDDLVSRVAELAVAIDEEEDLSLFEVTARASDAFDGNAEKMIFFRRPGFARPSDLLARRMRCGGHREFDEFVLFHRRLAYWFSHRYSQLTDELDDLEQVATIGLIRAAKTFEPRQGTAFSTYAFHVMQTECWRYLPASLRLGRLPHHVYRSFITILRETDLAWHEGGPIAAEEAFQNAAQKEGFEHDMAGHLRRYLDASLLHPASVSKQSQAVGVVEYDREWDADYREPLCDLLLTEQSQLLHEIVDTLPPKDQLVIRHRFGLGCEEETLEQVGERLGVTRERIRQREQKALRVLRDRVVVRLGLPDVLEDVGDDAEFDDDAKD